MRILKDVFTPDQVQLFKDYWANNQDHTYINWELDGKILDQRLALNETSAEYDLIKQIVLKDFVDPIEIWTAYQRQALAHHIHIDDFKCESPYFRYTYVFSLDTVPEFKTIVWKETAPSNEKLKEHMESWGDQQSQLSKISNISECEDLEHTYDENNNNYFCDYLTLDGIYTYQAGSGVLFDATQYHCTSNWLKYPQFTHRELLQVHVLTKEPISIQ